MLYIEPADDRAIPIVELTRRNLEMLLRKLDDPLSKRSIVDKDSRIRVTAVENEEHYSDREAGPMYTPSTGEIL